ncbi:MAG: FkbM family methyltransferase [Caldimonas sp.]
MTSSDDRHALGSLEEFAGSPPGAAAGAPAAWNEGLTARIDALLRWLGHQRWLRYGARDRLLRALRNPETIDSRSFEADFAGFRYQGDLSRWIDWIVYFFGAYELDELELVRRLLPADGSAIALDIGANVGHHSLFLASCCAQVHAFEPFDGVARFIDEKIARNGFDRIVVHRVGLSDGDADLPYFAPGHSNVGNGTFVAALADGGHEATCTLSLRHGDRYLDELALPRIDFVKIDVEGFELKVLEGLQATLRTYRPIVMLEVSDTVRAELGSLPGLMALFPPGYEVFRLAPPEARFVLFSSGHAMLAPPAIDWAGPVLAGEYVNLLLRPRV